MAPDAELHLRERKIRGGLPEGYWVLDVRPGTKPVKSSGAGVRAYAVASGRGSSGKFWKRLSGVRFNRFNFIMI
jgi:hypothetical protein